MKVVANLVELFSPITGLWLGSAVLYKMHRAAFVAHLLTKSVCLSLLLLFFVAGSWSADWTRMSSRVSSFSAECVPHENSSLSFCRENPAPLSCARLHLKTAQRHRSLILLALSCLAQGFSHACGLGCVFVYNGRCGDDSQPENIKTNC